MAEIASNKQTLCIEEIPLTLSLTWKVQHYLNHRALLISYLFIFSLISLPKFSSLCFDWVNYLISLAQKYFHNFLLSQPLPSYYTQQHTIKPSLFLPVSIMSTTKKPVVCVFCGASPGNSPAHLEAARSLAKILHENNINLVYGGGTVGLMGEVARTLVSLSGPSSVHGIIPEPLVQYEQQRNPNSTAEVESQVYGRTTIVKDMHTRKHQMAQEVIAGGPGGGFVALSGGYGTLEELMEVTTWNQLGIHDMPVIAYNVDGYWNGLIDWVNTAVKSGFVGENNKGIIAEAKSAEDVLEKLKTYQNAEGRFGLTWDQE